MRKCMIMSVAALVQVCGFAAIANPPSNVTGTVPAVTTKNTTNKTTGTTVTDAGKKLVESTKQQNGNKTVKTVATKTQKFGNDPFPAFSQTQRPVKTHIDLTMAYLGEWSTTTNAWTETTTQPTTTQGKARFFPTMGGRFVCGDTEGELFGKPFKSMGFIGFNATSNRYESSWVNTTDTGIAAFNGERNSNGAFTWTGNTTSPITGKTGNARATTTFNGKDSFTYTFYTTGTNGQEFKVYETTYNRVSQGGPFAIRPVEVNTTARTNQQGTTPQRTTGVSEQGTQIDGK